MSEAQSFRLEEYRSLRKEVEIYLTESRSQERYTLIAIGVIVGWLLLNHVGSVWLWSVPFALTIATTGRMIGIMIHFINLKTYIRSTERAFGVFGWESRDRPWSMGAVYVVFNVILLVLTGVAVYFHNDMATLVPIAPASTAAPAPSHNATSAPTRTAGHIGPDSLYPDSGLTPGAADTLSVADLTARYTDHCPKGKADCTYSQSHRSVSKAVHTQVYVSYRVPPEARNFQQGEVDHFFPLCAGGSNDAKNLWYEPAENIWNGKNFGYHAKDNLEKYICRQIVAKQLDPKEAYRRMTTDWVAWYLELGFDKADEGADEEID